ncbi:TPA: hypothetical protein ACQYB3_000642 [Vibrio parahaemolyticus]|uniref:hypothetical protein n=2 Tax=Vibrio harveyi group TaxID=717610 RepID=UPI0021CE08FB|nr:hypothetical protein [Vibrio alginolyticus]ELA7357604.1 hypothetical protein [Vibrio alginolyticus]
MEKYKPALTNEQSNALDEHTKRHADTIKAILGNSTQINKDIANKIIAKVKLPKGIGELAPQTLRASLVRAGILPKSSRKRTKDTASSSDVDLTVLQNQIKAMEVLLTDDQKAQLKLANVHVQVKELLVQNGISFEEYLEWCKENAEKSTQYNGFDL